MVRLDNTTEIAKLTAKDKKIIAAMVENSRIPLSKLTKKVALSRDAVDYRIKRMIEKKVIQRFHARINYAALGYNLYHVFFLMDEVDKQKQLDLIEALKKNLYTISVIEYNDKWDLEVTLLAKNVKQFDEVLMNIINDFPQLLLERDKLVVIQEYSNLRLPIGFVAYQPMLSAGSEELVMLNSQDKLLLSLLCEDARLSSVAMGKKMGLSSDAVLYRIRQLQEKKVIMHFTAEFNLSAMGYSWYTCGIEMKRFDKKNEAKLAQFVKQHPSIIRGVKTLGTWDVLLYVAAQSPREFHATLKEIKKIFSDIIRDYDVWIAYIEHYHDPFPEILSQ